MWKTAVEIKKLPFSSAHRKVLANAPHQSKAENNLELTEIIMEINDLRKKGRK
jgi:hypothetical protein